MENQDKQGARIFLIDDHPAVRGGLGVILTQEGYVVCGEAESLRDTRAGIEQADADLCLLDLSLCGEEGLEIIDELQEKGIAVLVYSMREDSDSIAAVFAAGAAGYVTKREAEDVLLAGIGALLAGERFVSPRAAESMVHRLLSAPQSDYARLSCREKEILERLGAGDRTGDIAAAFAISDRTVETYYSRIIGKLSLDGMKELRRYTIRNSPSLQQQSGSSVRAPIPPG